MKKIAKIFYSILILTMMISFMPKVKAASAQISVYHSKTTVIVGNTFTTTITVSSGSALGSWQFDVKYDTSKLTLVNSSLGGTYVADVYKTQGQKTATYTFTFRAKASGTSSVYIANARVIGYDEVDMTTTKGSASVKTMTQSELESTYSKDNYLSSLSVDGYTLSPTFNKDLTEYSLSLENDVTKIKVNAKANDGKSSVKGTGEVTVSEGENKIDIVVTAENGNTRTYTIKATVKELSPVEVTIGGNKYSVIRKKELLEAPNGYTDKTVTIDGEEVPGFYNEIVNYTLIGLKDSEGNTAFYIYDSNNNSYTKYEELSFGRVLLRILTVPTGTDIPTGYKETTITLNGKEVKAYKLKDTSRFSLIYGINLETGNIGFYEYDSLENSLQRYNEDDIEEIKKNSNIFLYCTIGLGSTTLILLIFLIIVASKKRKNSLANNTNNEIVQGNKKDPRDRSVLEDHPEAEQTMITDKKEKILSFDKNAYFDNNNNKVDVAVIITNNTFLILKEAPETKPKIGDLLPAIPKHNIILKTDLTNLGSIESGKFYHKFSLKDGTEFLLASKTIINYLKKINSN